MVVVAALLIPDLTTASGFIPVSAIIVTMIMVTLMPDFQAYKVTVEELVANASKVPLTLRALDLKPLSASSILVVAQEAALNLPLMLEVSLLLAMLREMSQFPVTLVPLNALIQLSIVVLLEKKSVLVDVWVKVLALMVFVLATMVTRVKIVL